MGICNNTNEGHIELVFMICKIILEKPRTQEEITSILNPDGTHLKKPQNTIKIWKKLDLFQENKDIIDLSDYAKSIFDNFSKKDLKSTIAHVIRRVLFSKNNTRIDDLWKTEDGSPKGASDFFVPLCWFLIQNPFKFQMTSFDSIKTKMSDQRKKNSDREIIQNNTRYPGLISYCHYLGFFSGNRKFNFIDPTEAIASDLNLIIQKSEEIEFKEFLKRLCEIIPVIDKGTIRKEVEKYLDERYIENIDENTISASLSLALSRLQELKVLKFESRGDAESSYNFSKIFNKKLASHVVRI